MNFLLKIVEGPNKGAEVALPEGVAVTLGKGEDCDIVLADATMPDEALSLKAAPDGVTMDGSPIEPFHVVERGATAFAVGPADAPWGELVWAARGGSEKSEGSERSESSESSESSDNSEYSDHSDSSDRRRRGCLGCFVALVLLLLALVALGWFFRDKVRPYAERAYSRIARMTGISGESDAPENPVNPVNPVQENTPASPLAALASRHGLVASGNRLSGNFATRAERLAATAEAYAAQPGIELDFSDDESLRTAAEDTFALVGEADLRVAAATNRVLALSGAASDLRRVIDALRADLPKLRDVDCAGVAALRNGAEKVVSRQDSQDLRDSPRAELATNLVNPVNPVKKSNPIPALPVCGILTTPYPCLVLRNGSRVMEGAPMGGWTVAKIEADSVTLTNAERSVTWNP